MATLRLESRKPKNPNKAFTSTYFPPIPDNADPKDFIVKKKFVPETEESNVEQTKEKKQELDENTRKKMGQEIQEFYSSVISKSETKKRKSHSHDNQEYCEICKEHIPQPRKVHITTVPHLVSEQPKPQKSYYLQESNVGYKMLKESYGWSEEQGLGRDNQGNQDPVKTLFKADRKGLGAVKMRDVDYRITHPEGSARVLEDSTPKKVKKLTRDQKKLIEAYEKQKEVRLRRELYDPYTSMLF